MVFQKYEHCEILVKFYGFLFVETHSETRFLSLGGESLECLRRRNDRLLLFIIGRAHILTLRPVQKKNPLQSAEGLVTGFEITRYLYTNCLKSHDAT